MIDGIGKGAPGSPARTGTGAVERTTAAPRAEARSAGGDPRVGRSLYADLAAAAGPPYDAAKVREIRAAIAEGRYALDPDRTAAAMLALDLAPEPRA